MFQVEILFVQKMYYYYVSALPGGDETMLHSVHIVIIRRMAISDIPVPICWCIHRRSCPMTVVWRIFGWLSPTVVDVVSGGIPHSESVNTVHSLSARVFLVQIHKINHTNTKTCSLSSQRPIRQVHKAHTQIYTSYHCLLGD